MEYGHIDFTPFLTAFLAPDCQDETDLRQDRGHMFTSQLWITYT